MIMGHGSLCDHTAVHNSCKLNSIAMRLSATIQAQSLQAPRSDANDVGRGTCKDGQLDDDLEWIFLKMQFFTVDLY